jgi:hypothetical protein
LAFLANNAASNYFYINIICLRAGNVIFVSSELVTEGHQDKIADQISNAIFYANLTELSEDPVEYLGPKKNCPFKPELYWY